MPGVGWRGLGDGGVGSGAWEPLSWITQHKMHKRQMRRVERAILIIRSRNMAPSLSLSGCLPPSLSLFLLVLLLLVYLMCVTCRTFVGCDAARATQTRPANWETESAKERENEGERVECSLYLERGSYATCRCAISKNGVGYLKWEGLSLSYKCNLKCLRLGDTTYKIVIFFYYF